MSQQLETIDFEYTDFGNRKHGWARYFWDDLAGFVETAQRLDLFLGELERRCADLPFSEIQKEYDYQHMLMGGVSGDGEYKQRSLARLYNEIFGLRFESLNDAISRSKEDMTINTSVVMEETEFTSFLSETLDILEPVLQESLGEIEDWTGKTTISLPNVNQSSEMDQEEFYRLIDNPEDLVDLLSEFLNQLQGVLPNYDDRALFLRTLEKTPRYYLELAYPKLKDPDVIASDIETSEDLWDKFSDFFGLDPVFTPDIDPDSKEDQRKKKQYTVYSYWDGSVGRSLLDFYQLTWDVLDDGLRDSLQVVFPEVPNFKQEF
ncbi:MAG: hypothetical protein ABEI86_10975, partial [Halobacteriaceae archaeon]